MEFVAEKMHAHFVVTFHDILQGPETHACMHFDTNRGRQPAVDPRGASLRTRRAADAGRLLRARLRPARGLGASPFLRPVLLYFLAIQFDENSLDQFVCFSMINRYISCTHYNGNLFSIYKDNAGLHFRVGWIVF